MFTAHGQGKRALPGVASPLSSDPIAAKSPGGTPYRVSASVMAREQAARSAKASPGT